MTVTKFDYIAPNTIREAVGALLEGGKDAIAMAGGTDLLVKIRRQVVTPKLVVGLKKIQELDVVDFSNDKGLTIGATTTLSTVVKHKSVLEHYPTIAMAAELTATPQIRNMGTLVGNLCNASPSADNAPTLLAMGTILNVVGPYGNRSFPLDQFFLGPGLTTLLPGELVVSAFIPTPPGNHGTAYTHLSQRGKIDCSAVGVGTMVTINKNKFESVRLFVGACAPIPSRAPKAEKILTGNKIDDELIRKASLQVAEEMNPISDIRASAIYRKKTIAIMSIRALNDAKKMAIRKR